MMIQPAQKFLPLDPSILCQAMRCFPSLLFVCLILGTQVADHSGAGELLAGRDDAAAERSELAPGAVGGLEVGGAVVNINPRKVPVSVNGGMLQQLSERVIDSLDARSLVIRSGPKTISLTVVDACIVPGDLLGEAKRRASQITGIPTDAMMISATHTHSAPASASILGSEQSESYRQQLVEQLADSIVLAHSRLQPAEVGWGVAPLHRFIHCRRWLMQPGTAASIPLTGRDGDRVQMNPGHGNPNKIEQTGPVDRDVSVLAFRSLDGQWLAILGNCNTHYAGAPAMSSDYFGHLCRLMPSRLAEESSVAAAPELVTLMSNGTSGDANCIDYSLEVPEPFDHRLVAETVLGVMITALSGIDQWHRHVPLEYAERQLELGVRQPSEAELAQARLVTESWLDQRLPANTQEVYARETILLAAMPATRNVLLQAFRLGDLALTAIPCEVYGSTGLDLKRASPFGRTINIGLANDYLGYIPPPEQHALGGYTTWRARSSCLEIEAEPKIQAALIGMLKQLHTAAEPASCDVSQAPPASTDSSPTSLRDVPLSPEASLAAIEVAHPLRVELVAHEPQVIDPVAIAFDSKGQLWVVEMQDYPTGPLPGDRPRGRIRVLSDSSGDGHYDRAVTFAEHLLQPTGLTFFGPGVIVTMAGEVAYMADTDGDGRCDLRQTWFTGFAQENEQLRANHPTWTIDGRIHVANGLRGGQVVPTDPRWPTPDEPLSLNLRDFAFSPWGGDFAAVVGNSQFGFFEDDDRRQYTCSNRNPCRWQVAPLTAIGHHPLLTVADWTVDLMPAAEQSRVHPLVEAWTTSTQHAGQFTAACGVYRYQSDRLAPWLGDDFLACEPTGSLVQRQRQTGGQLIPSLEAIDAPRELLASRDAWFRPVSLADGPDGSLYIVDMHRAVIEHPNWVPDELKDRADTWWGNRAGRIYRLVPAAEELVADELPDRQTTAASTTDLAALETSQLVRLLGSPNRWRRTTAHRLLLERAWLAEQAFPEGPTVKAAEELGVAAGHIAAELRRWFEAERSRSELSVPAASLVRGLWLLRAIGQLRPEDLRQSISHPSFGVRAAVAELAIGGLPQSESAELVDQLAIDPDPAVRLPLILALIAAPPLPQTATWVAAALTPEVADAADSAQWLGKAAASLPDPVAEELLGHLAKLELATHPTARSAVEHLAERFGWQQQPDALRLLLSRDTLSQWQATSSDRPTSPALDLPPAATWLIGLQRRGATVDQRLQATLDQTAQDRLEALWQHAALSVQQSEADQRIRQQALRVLATGPAAQLAQVGLELLRDGPAELIPATVELLRRQAPADSAAEIVAIVPTLPPSAAAAVVGELVNRPDWTPYLIDALEQRQLAWGLLDPAARNRLARHPDADIQQRYQRLADTHQPPVAWQEVLARYQDALHDWRQKADPLAGRQLFRQHCASCHALEGFGHVVGPDLSDLRTQTVESLLVAVLDPSAAIDAAYFRTSVLTVDGQLAEGLLIDRSAEGLTLVRQGGIREFYPTADIEQVRTSDASLMPEGFEQSLDPTHMRDLLAYLKLYRYLDGNVPLAADR